MAEKHIFQLLSVELRHQDTFGFYLPNTQMSWRFLLRHQRRGMKLYCVNIQKKAISFNSLNFYDQLDQISATTMSEQTRTIELQNNSLKDS